MGSDFDEEREEMESSTVVCEDVLVVGDAVACSWDGWAGGYVEGSVVGDWCMDDVFDVLLCVADLWW